MKIIKIEDLQVAAGWSQWSLLKITTDDGLVGWAEFNERGARRGATQVIHALAPLVMGQDPRAIGRIDAKLQREARVPGGGLHAVAVGAYQNALLDLKAKALSIPVYEMLGGPLRTHIPVYWSHCGSHRGRQPEIFEKVIGVAPVRTLDDIKALGGEVADKGYKALKTNLMIFDKKVIGDGPPLDVHGSGPFEMNIESSIVGMVVDQLSAFRDGAGPGVRLMLDTNFNYKPEGYRQIAKAVEPLDMMWLEMDLYEPQALAAIRQSASTPIGSLEAIFGRRLLKPFLDHCAVDVCIIDPVWNGMIEALRMASLADIYDVNVAAHNSHGPLGSVIAAHFCAVMPNFRIMELDVDSVPWWKELLTVPAIAENGAFPLPTGPGWGADVIEEVALAHPARR